MKLAIQLALRNLLGAGLRTWLNVIVLSFSFVVIIWHKGFLDGWHKQAKNDMIAWEIGGGQYHQENYDPYDPFSLAESHDRIPSVLYKDWESGQLTPLLITQGTLYPQGRMLSVIVKGIDPSQKVMALPSALLDTDRGIIPAIVGTSMAGHAHLKRGDEVMLRWRDKNGAFDAAEVTITDIYKTTVPTMDVGQIWIPIQNLWQMTGMTDEATLLIASSGDRVRDDLPGWEYHTPEVLLEDVDAMIQSKTAGGAILWIILLSLAMLAIFDTQVLSIFRRQKEIGTYVAMGMTRMQVVALFTTEGAMHGVLAVLLGAVYGIPLLALQAVKGFALPVSTEEFGISMAERIYPAYGMGLIGGTLIVILVTTTLVSYWPSRRIAKMSPTDALRGRVK